ncbi:HNH endonuclease [Klebsiella pneumoniae]|jgi:5-methylcytosine-specific restriction endonuclease McrA|uniref:HNH endonuclease n=1 Tax=Klebsiella pneumoniae TaxID=573 RepID=UPI00330862D9|nr:HNH endonuclease [Klebsiella pneumoniae]UMV24369.1 HNH endonuclease [Klebsiella pneumoniae]HDG7755000.1 HNH endonuclease [Klebsiella quasipneumoniae]
MTKISSTRSYEHSRAIALAKIREGYNCELRCGTSLDINGHHILDYSLGGEATPENILVVCKKCHDLVHAGEIVVDTFDYRPSKL